MALQASYFPSSSSSSAFSYEWPYDVFLSFRGSDTRHGFTGNLYKALSNKGIHTFFDDQELQGGEEITPALVKAIQDSRIAIVVFSVNCPFSSFCLHELATIMECVKGKGRLVLPVFYDVDPCDVRHQKGSYGEAMTKHEERFKHDKEKVQKWKEALHQAANLSGKDFKFGNGFEYVFIQNIVKMISKKISCIPLDIADHPIGLGSRVLEVNSLLNDGLDDGEVLMVGIYGIGGIGKTTLARAIYNFIADQFEGSCFLENVREKTIKFGLVHLQEMLLFEMLGEKDIKLGSVSQGISMIKRRLHEKKVLLVLDDVDKLEQLRGTARVCDWFGSGSRVIITTRDTQMLASHDVKRKYEVKGLSEEEALELLRWNAFKDDNIDPTYMDILKHAVTYACGLPLALEVIGSKLSGKSIDEWISALKYYERIPSRDIQKILEISFHDLEECQQKIFLDIACFSNGYYWPILYARHDDSLEYGISVLVKKSLIKIDKSGHVTLHDLIRDMGREIIRRESPEHLGNRSRLWFPKDIIQFLEENKETSKLEIMLLDAPILEKMVVEWDGETFKTMRNLEVLIIRNTHFSQSAKHLPNSLRVLEWWNYPSNSLPSDFYPKKLAIFKLPGSNLMSVGFIEKRRFMNLKALKLDESNIEYIPDVSGVPNLGTLSFHRCTNLIKVHESVGFMAKLSQLDASRCSKLRSFPALMLPCLEELNLSWCSSLENFPEILGDMKGLAYVDLYNTSIKELQYSFTNLRNLESLRIDNGIGLYKISGRHDLHVRGFVKLQFPKEDEDEGQRGSMVSSNALSVSFEFRNMLEEFFVMFLSLFRHVATLDLSQNYFTILPESIKELCTLRKLTLDNCNELREIRGIPPNVKEFSAANCMSCTILPESFKELCSLRKLTLDDCWGLREIRGIPRNIEEFSAANCMSCTILPESFKELCSLRKLTLDSWRELREIRGIPPNIEEFTAVNCMSLTILPESIKELCSLRKLILDGCTELREIRGIPPNIKEFVAVNCMSLTSSCRSMLLNEEYYSRNGYGYKRFYLPGGSIPKWFEHSSRTPFPFWYEFEEITRNSISFWFRNKPPSISVCVVWRPDIFDFASWIQAEAGNTMYPSCYFGAEVYINRNKIYSIMLRNDCIFTHAEDRVTIFNQGRILSNHELAHELLLENEWNHVVIVVSRGSPVENFGIHVHKHETNMEDIRFTDPLLQEKEVNMGDFRRDTEQEKNLTMLASVETSLRLPLAMNSFKDNVNGDLNSGSADLSKDKGKDLIVYSHSSEENSMHSCGQELLDKNWESNSMKLASKSDTIREDSSCHDNLCTLKLGLDSEVDSDSDSSCHDNLCTLKLGSDSEVDSDSDSIMSFLASDTDSDGAGVAAGSDHESWMRNKELLSLPPCWEEPLDRENLGSNLMQLASTSDTIKDQGSAGLSKDKGKDPVVYDYSEQNSKHSFWQQFLGKNWESNSMKLASTSDTIREDSSCYDSLSTWSLGLDSEVDSYSGPIMSFSACDTDGDGGSDHYSWMRNKKLLSVPPCWEEPLDYQNWELNLKQLASKSDNIRDQGYGDPSTKRKRSALMLALSNEPISEIDSDLDSDSDSDSVMARMAILILIVKERKTIKKEKKKCINIGLGVLDNEPINEMDPNSDSVMARLGSDTISEGGDECLLASEREGSERDALTNSISTVFQCICKCFGF